MFGLVAAVAVNVWLFRLSILLGIIGLNITKHLVIAYLCQVLGVDRRTSTVPARVLFPVPQLRVSPHVKVCEPARPLEFEWALAGAG